MEGHFFEWAMCIVCICGGVAIVFLGCWMAFREHKNSRKQPGASAAAPVPEPDEEPDLEPPALEEIYATVVDLRCEVKMVGLQTPKTIQCFEVLFQTRNRDYLRFQVPEEMYHGLEVGQSGMLSYIDGNLYGFALEETDSE